MRIAVQTYFRRKVAGAEAYMDEVLAALSADNELALLCDEEGPASRPPLNLPRQAPIWSVGQMSAAGALSALKDWRPDLIYAHGTNDPGLQSATLRAAPGVFMAHTYFGTCISGTKTCLAPVAAPCRRTFGPACLLHYFPHRCGGLNPLTMIKLYRTQARRQRLLRRYRYVLTLSTHMREELLRHGLDPMRVVQLPPADPGAPPEPSSKRIPLTVAGGPRRLLFLGRLEHLKGGQLLIEALPRVVAAAGPVHLVIAGDGPELPRWKALAEQRMAADNRLTAEFTGWVGPATKHSLFDRTDLLVVPSIWPEPFGLVGFEAARHGVPSVGFDVGGIRDWLRDGQTGLLAPSSPPTAAGLAETIVRCLIDRTLYDRLASGALKAAGALSRTEHLAVLRNVLERAGREYA